jgi:hypothetical protein
LRWITITSSAWRNARAALGPSGLAYPEVYPITNNVGGAIGPHAKFSTETFSNFLSVVDAV